MAESTWSEREESRFTDRAGWEPGDWDDEPDRVEWRWLGPPKLPCLIVRGPSGALCGYVGVPPGHPYYELDYQKCDVHAHGSLTYADRCAEDGHICHVARSGEAEQVWWLGFDCAHGCDRRPGSEAFYRARGLDQLGESFATYKSIAYVRSQVESLAHQLCRVAKGLPAQQEDESQCPNQNEHVHLRC